MPTSPPIRLFDGSHPPTNEEVVTFIGPDTMRRWERLVFFIADTYLGVFPPDDWIFGGKKHGWGLRFRKSKALLTLVPERGRVLAVIVFNGKEREAMGPILGEFEPIVRGLYENAHTYHDGTWLAIPVEGDTIVCDIERLLAIKWKPKRR